MKFNSHLEIINNLAVRTGHKSTSRSYYSQLSLGKDPSSGKYFLIINNTAKPVADKFKLQNNVEKIYCKFINEGKATIALKDPNFNLILQKADVNQLKSFLKIIHLAANSPNFNDESIKANTISEDLNKENQKLKKPVTSVSIKSKSEYNSNFRAIISQNLTIKSKLDNKNVQTLNLLRLTINNCELKQINASIQDLKQLVHLDLSNNKLSAFDNFSLNNLQDLNLSCNEIKYIGKNCHLPNLSILNLNSNQIRVLDQSFCNNFRSLTNLLLKSNKIEFITPNFGYNFLHLKHLDASNNLLDTLPFSLSYLRLETLELQNNPFDFGKLLKRENEKKFPTLVEICARKIINKKIKYAQRDIPRTLHDYIGSSIKCVCGQSCFEYNFKLLSMLPMSQVSKSFTYFALKGFDNQIPIGMTLCSLRCFLKNNKMHKFLTEQTI